MWSFLLHVYLAQRKRKSTLTRAIFYDIEKCDLQSSHLAPPPSTFQQNFWNSSHGLQTFPGFSLASHSVALVMRKVGRVYRGPREEMFKESLLWAAADHGSDDERSSELPLRSWLWQLHRWEAAEQLEARVDLSGFWMKNWLNRGKWKLKEDIYISYSLRTDKTFKFC